MGLNSPDNNYFSHAVRRNASAPITMAAKYAKPTFLYRQQSISTPSEGRVKRGKGNDTTAMPLQGQLDPAHRQTQASSEMLPCDWVCVTADLFWLGAQSRSLYSSDFPSSDRSFMSQSMCWFPSFICTSVHLQLRLHSNSTMPPLLC